MDVEALTVGDGRALLARARTGGMSRCAWRCGRASAPWTPFTKRATCLALDRLRGQQVLLNFWQSWSAPCLRELRRLQRLHEESSKHGLVIMARQRRGDAYRAGRGAQTSTTSTSR